MNYIVNGFLIELALIMSVGMQNAFILRQGIRKEHVIIAIITCTFAESTLLVIGTAGMGAILSSIPNLIKAITIIGILFLVFYAAKSIYMAIRSDEVLEVENELGSDKKTFLAIILAALGFGFLNPHVIIDTTLMGTLAVKNYPNHWYFCLGAVIAAFVWYCFLGLLGNFLARPLNRPKTWKVINIAVALLCLYMAYNFTTEINSSTHDNNEHIEEVLKK